MVSRPHGGTLVNRVANGKRRELLLEEFNEIPEVIVDDSAAADVENIGYGVFSPLEGFMVKEEFESVLNDMRLPNDLPWALPIVLDVPNKIAASLKQGDDLGLVHNSSRSPLAIMHIEETYSYDKKEFASKVFKTTDDKHPGVMKVYSGGDTLLGGSIDLIGEVPNPYEKYTLRPIETRILFEERGWRTVVGFQTRNPPHIGHEFLQKTALGFVDGVFINPVIGKKKRDDFKDDVILATYDALIRLYHRRDTAVMSVLRFEMRYAGPREAIFHAIVRKNFGCTHFIVGRDHAGVGNYYRPYEAQEIFKEFPDLQITPVFFREFFYCKKCGGVVHEKTCPHGEEDRVTFSGTKIRSMIEKGERPPAFFMRPEIVDVIMNWGSNPFVG